MREIIFRGKDRTGIMNHLWQEGSLDNTNEEFPKIVRLDRWGNKMLIDVAPETVVQFTGLTDKNGKRIFEGDILESRASENKLDWKRWKVHFEDGCFVFDSFAKVVESRRKYRHEVNMLCADEIELYGLVVVGNIHDNHELMEEGCEETN